MNNVGPYDEGIPFPCIPTILSSIRSTLPVMAQAFAGSRCWRWSPQGHIYDDEGIYVARDFEELGELLLAAGWLVMTDTGTWVDWAAVKRDTSSEETQGDVLREHAFRASTVRT